MVLRKSGGIMRFIERFVSFLIRTVLILLCGMVLSVFGAYLVTQTVLYFEPLQRILGLGGHMSGFGFIFWSYWACYPAAIGVGVWLVAKLFKEPGLFWLAVAATGICAPIFLAIPFALYPEYSATTALAVYLRSDATFLLELLYAAVSLYIYKRLIGFGQRSRSIEPLVQG